MKLTAKANFQPAIAKMQRMGTAVKKTGPDLLRQGGRLMAISCAKSTQPYGTGKRARDAGENAVARDLRYVYLPASRFIRQIESTMPKIAQWFARAAAAGDAGQANLILQKIKNPRRLLVIRFDAGQAHRLARGQNGRVRKQKPQVVVLDENELAAYALREKNQVGFAKGAWAGMGRVLGGIRGLRAGRLADGGNDITATWILRHSRRSGTFVIKENFTDPVKARITLTSTVRYADQVLSGYEAFKAQEIAKDRLQLMLQYAARAEARAALNNR